MWMVATFNRDVQIYKFSILWTVEFDIKPIFFYSFYGDFLFCFGVGLVSLRLLLWKIKRFSTVKNRSNFDTFPNPEKYLVELNKIFFFYADYCSHFQSWRYWSKSLTSKKLYPAKRCKSWRDFKSGRCDNNPTNFMGYNSLPIEGVFFNEIKANRSYFQGVNAEIYNYVASSFNNRSTIAQFLKKLNVLLWGKAVEKNKTIAMKRNKRIWKKKSKKKKKEKEGKVCSWRFIASEQKWM